MCGIVDGVFQVVCEVIEEGVEIILGFLFFVFVSLVVEMVWYCDIFVVVFLMDWVVVGNGVYLMSFMFEVEFEVIIQYVVLDGKF